MPKLIWHLDEPIADAAFITTYLVSRFAREDVTVILSGVGGDELFGGYRRYWSESLARTYNSLPGFVRQKLLEPIGRMLPSDRHSKLLDWSRLIKSFLANAGLEEESRYENFVRVFNEEDLNALLRESGSGRSQAMQSAFESTSSVHSLHRMIDVDLVTQLPDDLLMLTDRMSMAASLECRVPLLDDRALNIARRMPPEMMVSGTRLKVALKQSLRGILPDEIIDRKKRGFGAPMGAWLKNELSANVGNVLEEKRIKERGLFSWEAVETIRFKHQRNQEDYTDHLLSLVNLELWSQIYLDGDSVEDVADRFATATVR